MKKILRLAAIFLACICLLTACDPVLPKDTIHVKCTPSSLSKGDCATIEIDYPSTDNTAISKWGNPRVQILEGKDIVTISGLEITALESGSALLLIEVDADCTFCGIVIDRVTYSAELKIDVSLPTTV